MKSSTQESRRGSQKNGNGFHWKQADAYLFDIDGTLLLSPDRTHRYALHRALLDVYGVETTIDGIPYHGKTDPGILRAALERLNFSSHDISSKMAEALEIVRQDATEKADRFRPNVLPGIRDLLALLRESDKLLGICSGNLETIAWLKLKAAGLADSFEFGCFADDCELRIEIFRNGMLEVAKRLGRGATVCFLGDTPEDVLAARGAGGRIIAVGTGIFTAEDLATHGPDIAVVSCADLLAL
ncbi:MAG TPA: HAD family hydrolase, partial [Terriglobales bacterium]|nr:HAD family hydrolase [Terriglobales bacterium]